MVPLRIVHVVSYIQPEFGYEEYYTAREQAAMGHEVHVITSDRIFPFRDVGAMLRDVGSPFSGRKRPLGIEEIEGFRIHRHRTVLEVLYDFIIFSGVKEEILRLRPDVIHAHGLWQWGTYQAAKAKEMLGCRLIIDEHAYSTTYDQRPTLRNRLLDLEYRLLRAPFARHSLKRADEVVAICEETVEFLKEFYDLEGAHLIPLGVDHRLFRCDKGARERARARLGIEEDRRLIVTAGRLDEAKRLEVFIEALRGMDAKLIIAGRGDASYLGRLKAMAGPNVDFVGFKGSRELADLYCAADIGVWGKASITIREAMGCGLPLVLLDEPNMRDLLKWDNGAFVGPDPYAVREVLKELLEDPQRLADMRYRARRAVMEELSVASEAKDLLELYIGER